MNPARKQFLDMRRREREVAAELAQLAAMPNVRLLDHLPAGMFYAYIQPEVSRLAWPPARRSRRGEP